MGEGLPYQQFFLWHMIYESTESRTWKNFIPWQLLKKLKYDKKKKIKKMWKIPKKGTEWVLQIRYARYKIKIHWAMLITATPRKVKDKNIYKKTVKISRIRKSVLQISYTRNIKNWIDLGQYRRVKDKNVYNKYSKKKKTCLANQLHKLHTKFDKSRKVIETCRTVKEKNVNEKKV